MTFVMGLIIGFAAAASLTVVTFMLALAHDGGPPPHSHRHGMWSFPVATGGGHGHPRH